MTLFDNLKNKLFKEETSGKGKESQPAGKSKDLQDRIKGLFAKKPDEVEQAVAGVAIILVKFSLSW